MRTPATQAGRVAIISDLHSNLEALRAVLARIGDETPVWCLGDIVGYGPNPNETLALVRERVGRERSGEAILGNHDLAAIESYGLQHFNPAARTAIEWTQTVLAPEHVEWLGGLEYERRVDDALLVHGAPVRYFSYILDVPTARRAFSATDARVIFIGHSHIAEYYVCDSEGQIEHRAVQHARALDLDPAKRYIINVGSVGQPRDLNPESSFAFYDRVAAAVTWERVPYDIGVVREKIGAVHLPPYLGDRLTVGR